MKRERERERGRERWRLGEQDDNDFNAASDRKEFDNHGRNFTLNLVFSSLPGKINRATLWPQGTCSTGCLAIEMTKAT